MRILLSFIFTFLAASLFAADKPNILFILVDDMGYKDLAVNGSDLYRTPHLDQLAKEGTRFTHARTAAHVCSPTRASIVTGKYPARVRLTDWLPGHKKPFAKLKVPDWNSGLPDSEVTLAELLNPQGYATAWLGKWHLGGGAQNHGFQAGNQSWELNRKEDQEDPKAVFTLTDQAIDFIKNRGEKPFFVAISHYSVHGPIRFENKLRDEYQGIIDAKKPVQNNAGYAAMVEALDTSVGKILTWLKENKLAENTLVVFFSDNGGASSFTNNAPLRAGKGTLYEGGVRVPFIASWPGKIPAGRVSDFAASSIDFFPTFAALSGGQVPKDVDGIDLSSVLFSDTKPNRDTLYWHYPHYHAAKPAGSILKQNWKLIEWFETGDVELYDLNTDPNEERDLATTNPEKKTELLAALKDWQKNVDAQPMLDNPDYDPAKENQGEQKKNKKPKAPKEPKKPNAGKAGKKKEREAAAPTTAPDPAPQGA